MAVYYPGCPEVLVAPSCSDCPPKENGDVRSIALIEKDFTFVDITDPAEWTAGIMSKEIYLFPYTSGTFDQTETTTPGFGDRDIELDGYQNVLTIMEPQYKANAQFWDGIKNSKRWKAYYRTETLGHLSSVTATIVPKAPVAGDKKSAVNWNIIITWSQDNLLIPTDIPSGIFDQCVQPA